MVTKVSSGGVEYPVGGNQARNADAKVVFKAAASASQSVASKTPTKVVHDVELFDSHNCYDPALSRFTPNVAGYYQINITSRATGAPLELNLPQLAKNGVVIERGSESSGVQQVLSTLVYMNGTTDYLEVISELIGTSVTFSVAGDPYRCFFSGHLVRAD